MFFTKYLDEIDDVGFVTDNSIALIQELLLKQEIVDSLVQEKVLIAHLLSQNSFITKFYILV